MTDDALRMIVIVMGVSGSGKTTIGRLLAQRLGWEFHDGDDLHPPANVEKMRRGVPLTDADRAPWLAAVRALIERLVGAGCDAVIACSALKQAYRDRLAAGIPAARFVFLQGDPAVIRERLARRRHHFMPAELLQSQLDTLEMPRDAIVADVTAPPQEVVDRIVQALGRPATA